MCSIKECQFPLNFDGIAKPQKHQQPKLPIISTNQPRIAVKQPLFDRRTTTMTGDNRNVLVTSTAVVISSIVTAAVCCKILEGKHARSNSRWEKKRQEERTGRIRAEQKLREALSKLKKAKLIDGDDHILPLSTLGIVHSPYPKRMGTPRQGALVPSSRGCIEFVKSVPPELLDGIDAYSHLWVIFQFHENTSLATSKKTKIRPPRGGGIKVGQLATRSPHRPNPLGLSLVTIDR